MRLKRLILIREKAGPDRTLGQLTHKGGWLCATMEPGDADTAYPRLPPGFYHAVPHGWDPDSGLRFKRTWALVGANVSAQEEPGVPRAACLFHDGTRDEHTRGCILVGSRVGESNGEPGLLEGVNGEAMERLRDLIRHNEFYLVIVEKR